MDERDAMRGRRFGTAIALLALLPLQAQAGGLKYRQLPADEIRKRVVGMAITDDAHWSDHFLAGGVLRSYDLGVLKPGHWRIDGNELCLIRRGKNAGTDCFEIWLAGEAIEYRRDGVIVAEGFLRKIPP